MNNFKRGIGRVVLYAGVAGSMVVSILPAGANMALAQGASRNIGPNNIAVAGRFLEVWQSQGNDQNSVYVNGYPITTRHAEINLTDGKTYDTQWFERARYEAHPENKAPYDVLLGLLGVTGKAEGRGVVDPATKQVRNASDAPFVGIDKPADADGKTKAWFQETRHTIGGKILEYWNKYGGLQQFGYPLSEQFNEVNAADGKTYVTQYFQRNRFELHPEKAAPYEVELGLLGVEQYKAVPIAAADLPIAPPTGVTTDKDTLTFGSLQEPTTLVSFEDSTVVAQRFVSAIDFQAGVVGVDDKENYFPLAAWYVPTLENGGSYFVGAGDDRHLVVKYKLRRGIKYSDGKELTSGDMVFAYKLILDDPNIASRTLTVRVANVDNPDKYTALYNFMSLNQAKAKFADPKTDKSEYSFLSTFIDAKIPVVDQQYFLVGSIMPEHVLGKIPVDKINESDYSRNPIGYGPYKVGDFKPGDSLTLVQNDQYNLTAKPLIKRIVSKFNTDVATNVTAYQQGTLDAISGEGFVIPPEQTPQLVAAGAKVEAVAADSWEHLDFFFGFAPFKDKAVRQAIFQAINRKQVADVVYKGGAAVMNTVRPPVEYHSLEHPDFAKNFPDLAAKYKLPVYPYDPAAASKLLTDAGWALPAGCDPKTAAPGACVRTKGGVKLAFEYSTTRNVTRQANQALVANDLKNVGIEAQVKNYPTGYFDPGGPQKTGVSQLAEFAYQQQTVNNFDNWDSSQIVTAEQPGLSNAQQYSNPKVDAANRAFSSSIERHAVAEASAQAQVELANDVAVVPLVQRSNIEIYSTKMKNRKVTNTSASQWWNVTQWYWKNQ